LVRARPRPWPQRAGPGVNARGAGSGRRGSRTAGKTPGLVLSRDSRFLVGVWPALKLTPAEARCFVHCALLLAQPAPDLAAALAHLGYVQIDPINVCGRMHDLILRNRVVAYREGDLMRHLHGEPAAPLAAAARTAFEHHLPSQQNILVAFLIEAWPHPHAANRARAGRAGTWSGRLDARQRRLAERILGEITARGPLCSDDIDDDQRDHPGWGTSASLAKTKLQKLFFHGRVLIARRINQRRYYDLPERVLPAATLAAPKPTARESTRWFATLKLRQRRLASLKRDELRAIDDLVQPIAIEDCGQHYCLSSDRLLLLSSIEIPGSKQGNFPPRPSAPLDPLIYDRRLTARLCNLDYTWEVYTPPAPWRNFPSTPHEPTPDNPDRTRVSCLRLSRTLPAGPRSRRPAPRRPPDSPAPAGRAPDQKTTMGSRPH